ncbi:MAG TPA: M48 family metallopeptidase [Geminicoccaceae bacterium]|nr:M48 family metallopeptidase [Geminicoccaceae bacterium]
MTLCSCCLPRRRALALLAGAAAPLAGCASLVPEEQERQLGEQAFGELRQEMPRSDDATYQLVLERVGERIVRASEADVPPERWDFVVFESDQLNAFALPGGNVGVFEGMMRLVDSDDELAAVVGHEVGHVLARHAAQRIGTQQVSRLGIGVVAAALGAGGYADPGTAQALLGVGAQYGILLPFSRGQELEADRIGMVLMARAGYDPEAAIDFWRKMQAADGGKPPAFLSTHPADEERIARLREHLPEAQEAYRQAA